MGFGHTKLRYEHGFGHKAQGKGDPQISRSGSGYQTGPNKVRASGQLGGAGHRVGDGKSNVHPGGKGIFGK